MTVTGPTRDDNVTASPDARAAHHVLVVDDDSASLRYVGSLLMTHGYGVYAAGSGHLAIEIAERSQPDLILLDIRMPDLDGIETCRALKSRPQTAGIPVVFVTGRSDEFSMLEGFDAGGADYVVKPFEPAVLLARVGTHVKLGILSRDLERALGERTLELQAANRELRRLAVQVSQIEQLERARLAADLHDSPMQKLALAKLNLDALGPAAEPSAEQRIETARLLLREVMDELRALQFNLHPPVRDHQGLGPALVALAETSEAHSGIRIACAVDDHLPPLGRESSLILFQCARELLNNLVKHSGAKRGALRLAASDHAVELSVTDDGIGLRHEALSAPHGTRGGFGLYSIGERLKLLGGELRIETADPGVRFRVVLPIAATMSTNDAKE